MCVFQLNDIETTVTCEFQSTFGTFFFMLYLEHEKGGGGAVFWFVLLGWNIEFDFTVNYIFMIFF